MGTPANPENPATGPDLGLGGPAGAAPGPAALGRVRTPTLRNVDLRPTPGSVKRYMHNGAFTSLEEVVRFYNTRDVLPRCDAGADRSDWGVACWPAPAVEANVDHNVGLVLDAIDRLGIAENTLVFWCTDNGAERRRPWRGSAGPWNGFYNSAMEGGIRTPCVIRWTGRIPAGRVSKEIVHQVDFFPTIAAAVGAPDMVPTDRPIDGVDQLPFLTGEQPHSNRESIVYMAQGGRIQAVKWRDWKYWFDFPVEAGDPDPGNRVRLFNLRSDPKEETDIKDFNPWVITVMDSIVTDYEASVERFPNVPVNADDPYTPGRSGQAREREP